MTATCFVMVGLVPAIHDFLFQIKDMDGQDKPGHDTWNDCRIDQYQRRLV